MAEHAVTKAGVLSFAGLIKALSKSKGILLMTGDLTRIGISKLTAITGPNLLAFAGTVTNDWVDRNLDTQHGYGRRRKQYLPEIQTFFVDADESGNFRGEVEVPEGVIPMIVPRYIMEKDPEKMTQKEFNMWREATRRD